MTSATTNNNLVPHMLTSVQRREFNAHLREKMHNVVWLGKMVEAIHNCKKGADACFKWFPYTILPSSRVTKIIKGEFETIHLKEPIARQGAPCCVYLIVMPCIPDRGMDPRGGNIQRIINNIEDDAFHTTPARSLRELKGRVCMVIGLNTFYSINGERNEAFRNYTSQLETALAVRELAVKIVPFFWSPWRAVSTSFDAPNLRPNVKYSGYSRKPAPVLFLERLLLTVDKCYMLVKSYLGHKLVVTPDTKKTIEALDSHLRIEQNFGEDGEHPLNSIIPYQEIRTTILHSPELESFAEFFDTSLPEHPQYVVSLDADFVSLKTDETGLLSHYDTIIQDHYERREILPSVMSTGYDAPATEKMGIITAGLKLDRGIREAVAKTMPLAVYMPEPNFVFLLESPSLLKDFSFMKGPRNSMTAESRQLIKAAIKDGLIDPAEMTFIEKGAIQTTIDGDWRTQTVAKYKKVSRTAIYSAEIIKTLRGQHQSYADVQIWSNNIYAAIGKAVTNHLSQVIVPLKTMRTACEPYQFALDMQPQYGSYTHVLFGKVLSFMDPFLLNMRLALAHPYRIATYANAFASSITNANHEKSFLNSLFKTKVKAITEAEEKLTEAGYSSSDIENIRAIAIDSGAAIAKFFIDYR